MTVEYVCWKCGTPLTDLPRTMGRHDLCPGCRTELHVCRMCEFHDPRVSNSCREPLADSVNNKERANFCGYFEIRPDAHQPRDKTAEAAAQARLQALFGEEDTKNAPAVRTGADSGTERAWEQLEQLFGTKHSDGA